MTIQDWCDVHSSHPQVMPCLSVAPLLICKCAVVYNVDIVEHVLSQFLFFGTSIFLRCAFLPLVNLFPRFSDTCRWKRGGVA